jgi:hypothetical protein
LIIIKFGTIDQNESSGCCETRIKVGDYSLLEQDGKVFPSRRILEPKSHFVSMLGHDIHMLCLGEGTIISAFFLMNQGQHPRSKVKNFLSHHLAIIL